MSGNELVKIDITNAYNTVPHNLIRAMLDENGVCEVNAKYVLQ